MAEAAATTSSDTGASKGQAEGLGKENAEKKNLFKLDWYQTDSTIVVTVLAKNVDESKLQAAVVDQTLTIAFEHPMGDYNVEMKLSHAVEPNIVKKVHPSKVEIRLTKIDAHRWDSLEMSDNEKMLPTPIYPSSALKAKDWNKVVSDIIRSAEDPREEALNDLFNKIYEEGSDEVRKAMNKSFSESGGTVLSTNWKDVADGPVKIQPPHGQEWKRWD